MDDFPQIHQTGVFLGLSQVQTQSCCPIGYAKSVFGMITGEESAVTLEAENNMLGALIDRFGKDISIMPIDSDHFRANVSIIVSQQFIGWIIALGKGIRIVGPDAVVKQMKAEIYRLAEQYS